ncbi:MAG: bifunctional phosphoribosylaminoimidazolecarboxamide formyltransferase/IMP cyclohydrolase [Gemmataceae bacterium]
MSLRRIRRALLSVSDKSGLIDLARGLIELQVELISTGGTFKVLKEAGIAVREVADVTQFPEMLDGRVKTLHPKIHAGILAIRDNPAHERTLSSHEIGPIDLVVVNLYPFEATVAKPTAEWAEVIENIDVGGPTMIRAAAKNHDGVAVIVDPNQYGALLSELQQNKGATTLEARKRWAAAAFARTATYDSAISRYFREAGLSEEFPERMSLGFARKLNLRYGENPHQHAAFYEDSKPLAHSLATAEQLHGKELSYNNLLDLDSSWNLATEFAAPTAVVIKHNNPCGVGTATTLRDALAKAFDGDPLSAYGGVLAFNRPVDAPTAELVTEPNRFVEAIIAPDFADDALEMIRTRPTWKKNVRLLRTGGVPSTLTGLDFRRISGGVLVQSADRGSQDFASLKVVSKRHPTIDERSGLEFAWLVCKHVKSNAIVLAKGGQVVGVGAGQMSRVDSTEIAVKKAGERARGTVLASDAFFPFRDNVDAAAKAGVTAIIQPGGSIRDEECIAACDEHGLAMVFTGVRHFRH